MTGNQEKFFLAANSCEGFVSAFAENYRAKDGWRAYLVKGGPGTGKSSLMKYAAVRCTDRGERCILCPCSSDPQSLDGVIFPEKKVILLDATAPHTVEPTLPGACEQIADTGAFWNAALLYADRDAIRAVTAKNSVCHKRAARYLLACGQLMREELTAVRAVTDGERCMKLAERLCARHLPPKKGIGSEWVRFLEGVTPEGVIGYTGTVERFYRERIVFSDPYGAASGYFMSAVRSCALAAGYEIVTVKNAFLPSELTDHILIPELSLAFTRESGLFRPEYDGRRIHARRFTDLPALHDERQKFLFRRRVIRELLRTACACLAEAKAVHDELERYYTSAMDFPALTAYAAALTDGIM